MDVDDNLENSQYAMIAMYQTYRDDSILLLSYRRMDYQL